MSQLPESPDYQQPSLPAQTTIIKLPGGSANEKGQATPSSLPASGAGRNSFLTRQLSQWGKWIGSGLVVIFLIAAILYFIWPNMPGITVVVQATPADSDTYVDSLRRGIPMANGTIKIAHLAPKAGQYEIRVTHAGYKDKIEKVDSNKLEFAVALGSGVTLPSPQGLPPVTPCGVKDGVDMILITAGKFMMGADGEPENPVRELDLKAFYIDKYEVTNKQYKKFCEETGRTLPTIGWNRQYLQAQPDAPVVGITWDDAKAYADWAQKRLPTNEEWEKAASWGPNTTAKRVYPWGNDDVAGRAFLGQTRVAFLAVTSARMQGDVSAYGVIGMAGNALEWVDGGNPNDWMIRGGYSGSLPSNRLLTHPIHSQKPQSAAELENWYRGFRCVVDAPACLPARRNN